MSHSLFLSVRRGVSASPSAPDRLVLRYDGWSTELTHLPAGTAAALTRLVETGGREDVLSGIVLALNDSSALAQLSYYLHRLNQWCLLRRSARDGGRVLATSVAVSAYAEYGTRAIANDRQYVLSRFAHTRALDGDTVLESPLSHSRIILHEWRASALIHALARPRAIEDLTRGIHGLTSQAASQVLTLLLNAEMLSEVTPAGQSAEQDNRSLQSWEFHDLLFHSRSREGRHDLPVGGAYRFAGQFEPPPAVEPSLTGDGFALYRPDLEQLRRDDPPFTLVHETRRSIRRYDPRPLTVRQLGEFLYRVGRVTQSTTVEIETSGGPVAMEFARRPYPGAGALHELELYVAVAACEGLEVGISHYEPQVHRLTPLAGDTPAVDHLLRRAAQSAQIHRDHLQVLLIVAARFQRVAWKYSSMAYAAILKDVGVLYQTMYLVATAMGLAPCALGCGDSDLFAGAAGTNYYEQSSVGEFLLGRKGDARANAGTTKRPTPGHTRWRAGCTASRERP